MQIVVCGDRDFPNGLNKDILLLLILCKTDFIEIENSVESRTTSTSLLSTCSLFF